MASKKGRDLGSPIRDNIVELLYHLKEAYGYEIYKNYLKAFGRVNLRTIYYHLNKGSSLNIFKVKKIETVEGDYSWGSGVQRIVYSLDKNAKPKIIEEIKDKINN